jgi:hypothetical protein
MTDYRIIYPNDDNGVAIVVPAPGIEQTEALRAVPAGKPYLIVDASDFPADRTFRAAWQVDFADAPVKE